MPDCRQEDNSERETANTSDVFAVIILIDLLFFPRVLPLFGIPASLPFVITSVLGRKIRTSRIFALISISCICSISAINGMFFKDIVYFSEDMKRVLQLTTSLFYGLLVFQARGRCLRQVSQVLRVFFYWTFLLFVISWINQPSYYVFVSSVYPEAQEMLLRNLEIYRFAYFFTDPNTAGYFICFALFLYIRLHDNSIQKSLAVLLAIASVAGTQSRGAMLCIFVIMIHYLFSSGSSRMHKLVFAGLIGLAAITIYQKYGIVLDTAVALFESRLGEEEALGLGVGGGRTEKYLYFLKNVNLLPLGVGYSLQAGGFEFRPHSDLIRLNFSYGILVFIPLVQLVLPKHRSIYPFLIIFAIPFLINTVIDDYKLFPLYLFSSNFLFARLRDGSRLDRSLSQA